VEGEANVKWYDADMTPEGYAWCALVLFSFAGLCSALGWWPPTVVYTLACLLFFCRAYEGGLE
jgi:hypothetical protein